MSKLPWFILIKDEVTFQVLFCTLMIAEAVLLAYFK